MRRFLMLWFCPALLFLFSFPVHAAWTEGGNPLITAAGDQYLLDAATDYADGTIISWIDATLQPDVYVQRYDPQGNALWTANGVRLSASLFEKAACKLLPTVDQGAFVAWLEWEAADPTLYLQRFTSQGVPAWTDPLALGTVRVSINFYYLCEDASGGVIVAWKDVVGASENMIFAQQVDAAGAEQWGAGGVVVDHVSTTITAIRGLVPSNAGSALVFWGTYEENYMQKVSAGAVVWSDTRTLCANFQGTDFLFASDQQQGAIVGFNESSQVRLQRVDQDGTQLWGAAGGITLPTQGDYPEVPKLVVAPQGHALVTWQESVAGLTEVFLQRVNPDGSQPWGATATRISNAPLWQVLPEPTILSDGMIAVIWADARDILFLHLYHQQVNPVTGAFSLPASGVPVSVTPTMRAELWPLLSIPDTTGRATVFWTAEVSGEKDVWGMRLNYATQLSPGNAALPVLRSNEADKPVFVSQLTATGWDRLTSLRLSNLGTAQAGQDIVRLALYASDTPDFNPGTATWLTNFQAVDSTTWQTPGGFLSPQLFNGQYLICTANLSGQVIAGRTCQFSLFPQTVVFESGSTQPAAQLTNATIQTLELQEALSVELLPLVTLPVHEGQRDLALAELRLTNNRAEPLTLSKLHLVLRNATGQTLDPARVLSTLGMRSVNMTWVPQGTYSELVFSLPPTLTQSVPITYTLVMDLAEPNPATSISLCLEQASAIFDTTGAWLALGTPTAGGFPLCSPAVAIKSKNLTQSFSTFPNPFSASEGTRIGYYLENDSDVSLSLWTMTGRKVRTLLERAPKNAGLHQEDIWNGRNASGLQVISGTYLLRLTVRTASGTEQTLHRKVSILK